MKIHSSFIQIKELLDKKVGLYNRPEFIESDPIQVPHGFSLKEDIEIAGFLTATISWGQRKSIIKNAFQLISLMDNKPFNFICDATESDLKPLRNFLHRTFQGEDCVFFIRSLNHIYKQLGGLEKIFTDGYMINNSIYQSLVHFHNIFFSIPHPFRSRKHIANVASNASAKRLNMFLRWMIRKDNSGVDFGLWNDFSPGSLMLPLDVHTGNVARDLGLLKRKQNDWKAVEEITSLLRTFDPADPVKYDFALFGMGAFEKR
jgi:uncharacterized protein (TIGR02757 family)